MGDGPYPLTGVRVLDLGRLVSGPVCSFTLASLGAQVIRIDQPGGDLSWKVPPFVGPGGAARTRATDRHIALSHLKRDRGKRSVTIDIQTDDGKALLVDLVRTADVVVENFRAGVMDAWGLGYADLSAVNERLVYCSITGYGQEGPYRDLGGMDLIVQGIAGMMARNGPPDAPPTKVGFMACDLVPALCGALGVVAALRQRDMTGRGQHVDVGMLDVAVSLLWDEPLDLYADAGMPERSGSSDPRGAPVNAYRTADGWATVVVTSSYQFERLAQAIGQPGLAVDMPNLPERVAGRQRIDRALGGWTAARPTAEVVETLRVAGIPSGPVNPMAAARDDPQVRDRSMLEALRHPDMAPGETSGFLGPRLPIAFDSRVELDPAEPLGASTDAVLAELGRSAAEIARLRSAGVVG